MKRRLRLTFAHYHFGILMVILGVGIAAFASFAGNRGAQLGIGILTTVAYVAWGTIHHAVEGDLYPKVVVEYILIATIAIILLLTMVGF